MFLENKVHQKSMLSKHVRNKSGKPFFYILQGKQDWESIQDCEYVFLKVNAIFVKTMSCLSRTCLSRPCHVCQYYFMFFRTMSCLTRTCHFFQDHVMFFKTNLIQFDPFWSNLIPYDPTWYVYIWFYMSKTCTLDTRFSTCFSTTCFSTTCFSTTCFPTSCFSKTTTF